MTDGKMRRCMDTPERIDYKEGLKWLENFVDDELGNGGIIRPRPDIEEWKKKRAETIQTLNKAREKLDAICIGANYGKAGGNIAKILGTGGAIIGAFMCFGGKPSGKMVINIGILIHQTGALVDCVLNGIESAFSAKYLNDIKAILEEDRKLSFHLSKWMNASCKLDTTIQEIFGVSLTSEKYGMVIEVFCEFSALLSSGISFDEIISLMRKGKYSIHIGNDVKLELLQKFFKQLSDFPPLTLKLRVILSYLSELPALVQHFINGARAYQSFINITSSAATTLQDGLNPDKPTAGEVSVFCFFHSVSLSLSLISLMKTTSNIEHGKSKFSDGINELISLLDTELKQMENLKL